jgi:hypothetical protein
MVGKERSINLAAVPALDQSRQGWVRVLSGSWFLVYGRMSDWLLCFTGSENVAAPQVSQFCGLKFFF